MTRKKNSGDFLKECMADALFILLRTKSIEEITVSEITAPCKRKPYHLLPQFHLKRKCH